MLLWILILLPAIAGGLCYLIPSDDERIAKVFGILVSVATIV